MASLLTEWSTEDPALAATLRRMQAETDPVLRLELEAALHTFQAAKCLRDAGAMRERIRTGERLRHAYARVCCLRCRREVSVNAEGDLRPHGPVSARCPGGLNSPNLLAMSQESRAFLARTLYR